MVETPSGFPLLFDGLIRRVRYDSTSNTHDSSHFPNDWDMGQEGKLMSERWLFADKIGARIGFADSPDLLTIIKAEG